MARRSRIVIPGLPYHVTQRGNRRERIFLEPGDEAIYLNLMRGRPKRHGVDCWAYCLMSNHVHMILTPNDETGLARAISEAHRRYTAFVGACAGWTGHLFQGRFSSVAMDEDHLMAAFRYVALNPVKAGARSGGGGLAVVKRGRAYRWAQDTLYERGTGALAYQRFRRPSEPTKIEL